MCLEKKCRKKDVMNETEGVSDVDIPDRLPIKPTYEGDVQSIWCQKGFLANASIMYFCIIKM